MENKLYKIEKGIKIPAVTLGKSNGKSSRVAEALQILNKGESFLIKDEIEALKASKVMRDFTAREREREGKREFTSRKVGAGLRIWRVK